jgi:hypothetical protein
MFVNISPVYESSAESVCSLRFANKVNSTDMSLSSSGKGGGKKGGGGKKQGMTPGGGKSGKDDRISAAPAIRQAPAAPATNSSISLGGQAGGGEDQGAEVRLAHSSLKSIGKLPNGGVRPQSERPDNKQGSGGKHNALKKALAKKARGVAY